MPKQENACYELEAVIPALDSVLKMICSGFNESLEELLVLLPLDVLWESAEAWWK